MEKLNLFVSYAHDDANSAAFEDFKKYILDADQLCEDINPWIDGKILLGSKWNEEITRNLEKADIVILVISQSFLNSKYIKNELRIAFEKESEGKCKVIPLFFESLNLPPEYKFLENQGYPSGKKKIKDFNETKRGNAFSEFQGKIIEIINEKKGKASRITPKTLNSTEQRTYDQPSRPDWTVSPNIIQNDCKFFAIIIVNYDFEKMPEKNISNIKTNLESLKKTFITDYNIPERNITVLDNCTSYELNKVLGGLTKNHSRDDTLFVYYSGHGIPDSEDFYWATKDTEFEENSSMINLGTAFEASKINRFLSNSPAQNKILVCDCCYAEELLKGKQFINIEGYMKQKVALSHTFYLFSSEARMESYYPSDAPEKPTYFTDAFVRAFEEELNLGNSNITIGNIYNKTAVLIKGARTDTNPIPTPIKQPNDHSLDDIVLFINPKSKSADELPGGRAGSSTINSIYEIKTMEDAIKEQRRALSEEVYRAKTNEEIVNAIEKNKKIDEYVKQQEETRLIRDPEARGIKEAELIQKNPGMIHINRYIVVWRILNNDAKSPENQ